MFSRVISPNYISEESKIEGKLEFNAKTLIYGMIKGDLIQTCTENLEIGVSGWIKGNVFSYGPIFVSGKVEGNISSKSKICLSPSAMVMGNLEAHLVEIMNGALHNGKIKMLHSKNIESN